MARRLAVVEGRRRGSDWRRMRRSELSKLQSLGGVKGDVLESLTLSVRKSVEKLKESTEVDYVNDSTESVHSPISISNHGLKGALLKSKSFSTFNSKPKTKFVDDIPQKRKQSVVAKDRLDKVLGKSFSFKGSSSRINLGEAKVKMLSPRSSHVLELNGLKYSKQRSLERKSSIKSDNLLASQVLANGSKYQSHGEVKKLSVSCPVDNGTSSFNDPDESDDQKKNLLNSKDGATTLGSSRPGESTDQWMHQKGIKVGISGCAG
ncbi:hypothetical protein Droror1_Dr00026702 [Drosera rotundifolia]